MLQHTIIFLFICFTLVCVLLPLMLFKSIREHRQQTEHRRERRIYHLETQNRCLLAMLSESVREQKEEQPAVTVPVTNCDRRDRRRLIKLEK